MNTLPKYLDWVFKVIVSVSIFALFGSFIFLNNKINNTTPISPVPTSSAPPQVVPTLNPTSTPSVPTPTPVTLSSPTPKPTATTFSPKVTYIPLGIGCSTQATDWTDVADSQVYISLTTEYGNTASVWWEALLKVENGNGTTYARLFDVSHGIAVDGSQIALINTATPTLVEGGPLRLWAGRNLYKVQIKSLNSSTAYFDFGRIKVSY